MDVTQTQSEGLSRTFQVHVPASELEAKLTEKINEIRPQMNIRGFRPGKVPASHVKQMYGKSIMGDLVEDLIKETNEKAIDDAKIRAASQPDMHFDSEVEAVLAGKADLAYRFDVDIMPEFEPVDPATLTIERPVAEVSETEIEDALEKLAKNNTQYEPRGKTAKARDGDAVIVDFLGKIDGEPFDGGKAEDASVVIGAERFIPGFEEQLVGVKAGQETELNVTFPDDYGSEALAGKDAVFEVTVKEVRAPKTPELDDDFAKGLGLEDLAALKDMFRGQFEDQYAQASRQKAKRVLLDALDDAHDFELPPKMVDQEFDQIWTQLLDEKEKGRLSEEDAAKSDGELKDEYQKIAARRVRLGLVLAEIGRLNDIQITEQEVQQAVLAQARNFPGQEREFIQAVQNNPNVLAGIRAPIYEEKVVDHIFEQATMADKTVSKEDLFAEDDTL
ncbi:MAG: trigger factor [Pseudomonadota bacterium]